jgi:hypothetical protein
MFRLELQVRQLGLPRDELSKFMVRELELSCSPDQYLEETYKLHMELFHTVSLFLYFTFHCKL